MIHLRAKPARRRQLAQVERLVEGGVGEEDVAEAPEDVEEEWAAVNFIKACFLYICDFWENMFYLVSELTF